MRKIILTLSLVLVAVMVYSQTGTLRGTITDQSSGQPLPQVTVIAGLVQATTDAGGNYELKGLAVGKLYVTATGSGIETRSEEMDITAGDNTWSPTVVVVNTTTTDMQGITEVSASQLDLEDEGRGQSVGGLLQSSGDVFTSTAGYVLSAAYFKTRGFDSENFAVYMNGVKVNDAETGWPAWSEWGGLNDVTRNKEVGIGLNPSAFSFGFPGGATNIITRASEQRKQTKFTYSLGNRSYTHRWMFTHSTGMMENGWAFSVSASKRYGTEGAIDGLFYDSYSYFAAAEKKINDQHSLAFSVMGAPTKRAQRSGSTQEVYDLLGDNLYNANWGYLNGEKRASRIKDFHEPIFTLNHYWQLAENTRLTTSAFFQTGYNGSKALNWYNAADPRPDYYRNMPSYYYLQGLTEAGDAATEFWKTNPEAGLIDWNSLYQANHGQNAAGKQTAYIMENRRIDQTNIGLSFLLNSQITENMKLNGGLELRKYKGHHYKLIDDMLGGNFWVDVDQFAERDLAGDTVASQNDLQNPNRIVGEGDTYGYNYNLFQDELNLWANAEFTYNKIDFYVGATGNYTRIWREGIYQNGRFPDNSLGESEKKDFMSPGAKTGFTYKVNGRNFIQGNAMWMERAPLLRDAFISQRIRNDFAKGIANETIVGGDISYIIRSPYLKARLTAYQTMFYDQTELRSFYHDDLNTFVNMVMTGIDKVHQGVEFGAEVKLTTAISVTAVASLGNYRITSRPEGTITAENATIDETTETFYLKNFYVPGVQNAGSLGINYRHPAYWFFNANVNYFGKNYLDYNPLRRTMNAIDGLYTQADIDKVKAITEQQKLDDAITLDASIGKSIKMGKYFLNLNFSVSNILDNTDLVTGGYEQYRYESDTQMYDKFPAKYFYGLGRTYYLNIGFRF